MAIDIDAYQSTNNYFCKLVTEQSMFNKWSEREYLFPHMSTLF